jgi:hypothetical protein
MYYEKYLKYKQKYINLKNSSGGAIKIKLNKDKIDSTFILRPREDESWFPRTDKLNEPNINNDSSQLFDILNNDSTQSFDILNK